MGRSIDIRLTDEKHRGPSVYLSGAKNYDDFWQIFLSKKNPKYGHSHTNTGIAGKTSKCRISPTIAGRLTQISSTRPYR